MRRHHLPHLLSAGCSALLLASLVGCAGPSTSSLSPGFPPEPWAWRQAERALLDEDRPDFDIARRGAPGNVLRQQARPVPVELNLARVAARMERTMRRAGGVGIAGPQVGLAVRIALLMLDYKSKQPRLVFARNPMLIERSEESIESYEGCLSIPGVGGLVRRNRWIKVRYLDETGRVQTTHAAGDNAVLWQHELDHLEGILYIDRVMGELLPQEEVRRRRRALEQGSPPPSSAPMPADSRR